LHESYLAKRLPIAAQQTCGETQLAIKVAGGRKGFSTYLCTAVMQKALASVFRAEPWTTAHGHRRRRALTRCCSLFRPLSRRCSEQHGSGRGATRRGQNRSRS